MENLGGSLKMPQIRQKLVFGDGVDASMDGGGRRRPTADKDVEAFNLKVYFFCFNVWQYLL